MEFSEEESTKETPENVPSPPLPTKPLLRGVFHQFGAVVAVVAGILLAAGAPTRRDFWAVVVFAMSLVTLFSVSATYHRITWAERGRQWMRRADHAAIFVLIAGTYTPFAVVGLSPGISNRVLVVAWGGALVGVLQSLFWIRAPKFVVAVLAIVVGWSIVPFVGEVRAAYGDPVCILLLIGGLAYTLGAISYAAKRPVLVPRVFGYHEVFHVLTLVGAATHFEAVRRIIHVVR